MSFVDHFTPTPESAALDTPEKILANVHKVNAAIKERAVQDGDSLVPRIADSIEDALAKHVANHKSATEFHHSLSHLDSANNVLQRIETYFQATEPAVLIASYDPDEVQLPYTRYRFSDTLYGVLYLKQRSAGITTDRHILGATVEMVSTDLLPTT